MPTDLLFAYGTLMRDFALHRMLEGRAEYVDTGRVQARLIDLGAYAAAVRDAHGTALGEVYRVIEPGLWTALDSAEGPQYHRGEVTVRIASGGDVAAFMYWYVGPVGRGVPIPGGDYRAHPARALHPP